MIIIFLLDCASAGRDPAVACPSEDLSREELRHRANVTVRRCGEYPVNNKE